MAKTMPQPMPKAPPVDALPPLGGPYPLDWYPQDVLTYETLLAAAVPLPRIAPLLAHHDPPPADDPDEDEGRPLCEYRSAYVRQCPRPAVWDSRYCWRPNHRPPVPQDTPLAQQYRQPLYDAYAARQGRAQRGGE